MARRLDLFLGRVGVWTEGKRFGFGRVGGVDRRGAMVERLDKVNLWLFPTFRGGKLKVY